jgi:mannose-6-phosphate isomerase-like protein (cupin superfamily)
MPSDAPIPRKVDLAVAFARLGEHWSPRVAGEVNDFQVKLAKAQGEPVGHRHEREDELFRIVKGRLTMQPRTGEVVLEPGRFLIVPHDVEHCPAARAECWVLLLEPATTPITGDTQAGGRGAFWSASIDCGGGQSGEAAPPYPSACSISSRARLSSSVSPPPPVPRSSWLRR